ncbi:DNA-directed RNA polymerase 2B, chloroplastic/mitochondrial, partial [Linum perenne]
KIKNFLEKTKNKRAAKAEKVEEGEFAVAVKEQEKMRRKRGLIPVSTTLQVGSRVIELLIQSAYVQPPADQICDGPPDIRPAFIHTVITMPTQDRYASMILLLFN